MQMIIRHPHHPSNLCQKPDSIFLEQFVLVLLAQKKSLLNPGEEIMFRTSMLDDPSVLDEYSTVNKIICLKDDNCLKYIPFYIL